MPDARDVPRLLLSEELLLLSRLRLNAQAAARLCGISARQLAYWRRLGLLPSEGKQRGFGVAALNQAIATRRLLDQGYTLRRAAKMVQNAPPGIASSDSYQRERLLSRLADLSLRLRECRQSILRESFQQGEQVPEPERHRVGILDGRETGAVRRGASDLALRLNKAVDELASALEELGPAREPA